MVWLHSSAILGLAGLGEAFGRHGWIVFCGGMVCYRILTLFILIPLLRGFYFSKNILSDVHIITPEGPHEAARIFFFSFFSPISLFAAMVVARVCKLQSQPDGVVRVEKKGKICWAKSRRVRA